MTAPRRLAAGLVEAGVQALEDGPNGERAALEFCVAVIEAATATAESLEANIAEPPDVTGNPWPDCVCNDARYTLGHMQACPAYGRAPDAPGGSS